jgi:thymidylate kinase
VDDVADTGSTPRIIALVGIDGAGKTTQAHQLADWLTAHGYPADYRQNAGGRRYFGRLARRVGRRDALDLLGRRLLILVESVLRWLAIARSLRRSRRAGRIAVMDRYAVCEYASIRAHLGSRERLARLFYRLFPAPDITFYLALPPAEAHRRVEARGTDEEDPHYLRVLDAAYRALPEAADYVMIDATASPDQVHRSLRTETLRQVDPTVDPTPVDQGRMVGQTWRARHHLSLIDVTGR